MYQITVNNLSLVCESQEAVLGWMDFLLDQGQVPQITYKGATNEI